MAFRYSYSNFVYGDEPIEVSFRRLAESGYDGIELVGEPSRLDVASIESSIKQFGLQVSSIGSVYTADRDLASPEPDVRRGARQYVMAMADIAARLHAPVAIFAPTSVMKHRGWPNKEEEHAWLLEGMKVTGEYARSIGVNLAIEAWNRYETYMLNRMDQCLALAREIALPNVGVMADTFHMSIEERSIPESIRAAGPLLMHVHLADSNRSVPGSGHTDFRGILQALSGIDYSGYLTFELIPATVDPIAVLRSGGAQEFRDPFTGQAIRYMKQMEKDLSPSRSTGSARPK